jgi:CheY-like chemotaxis protein
MSSAEPKRILVVEDEMLIAMELDAIVQEFGWTTVGPATSCAAAVELLRSRQIDGAIVDFVLGDKRCDEVAAELIARGIPWALATGFDENEVAERFHNVPIIAKPYGEEDVRRVIGDLLSLPS